MTIDRNDNIFYFAYGRNMNYYRMSKISKHGFSRIGIARASNHRLGFTKYSKSWKGGLCDIVPSPDAIIYGILYKISIDFLQLLDKDEGKEYYKSEIEIQLIDQQEDQIKPMIAFSYMIIDREPKEISPSIKYLNIMINSAIENKFETGYVNFLKQLKSHPELMVNSDGLRVYPTKTRSKSTGIYILEINKSIKKRLKIGKYAILEFQSVRCMVKVDIDNSIDDQSCHLDQTIRDVLKLKAKYGKFFVKIHQVKLSSTGRLNQLINLHPRSLLLRMNNTMDKHDIEKNICVLHPKNINLLGLKEGEFVKLFTPIQKDGNFQIGTISLRVFSGSSDRKARLTGSEEKYPMYNKVYLDLESRTKLGIAHTTHPLPAALIMADVNKLAKERSVYYFISFLILIRTIDSLFINFLPSNWYISFIINAFLSSLIILLIVKTDIGSRVAYN